MKKEYEKPQILVEDYNITDLLATSPCEQKVNYSDGNTCHSWASTRVFDKNTGTFITTYYFNSGNSACVGGYMDGLDQTKDGICYHGPENNNCFTS